MIAHDSMLAHSRNVLVAGQAPSGALVAAPTFPTYRFGWLRDGAFCAYALDILGERVRAAAFHAWVVELVHRHRTIFLPGGRPPARWTLSGELEEPGEEEWPNFQLDGYGMWLWAFEEHLAGRRITAPEAEAVTIVGDYLARAWHTPCFNCWEEFDGGRHASTLAAVASGLLSAARLIEDERYLAAAAGPAGALRQDFVHGGRFTRTPDDRRVDGSLLWVGMPFAAIDPADPLVDATIAAVRDELCVDGGVRRYLGDTYYGGGQWLLLSSSLAWRLAEDGEVAEAVALQDWVRAAATPAGDLPEQITSTPQRDEMVQPWIDKWGPVATPLLWSHAMYVIAEAAIERAR
jgi:GH15 family glucan-1,4-alpha-glucosidase